MHAVSFCLTALVLFMMFGVTFSISVEEYYNFCKGKKNVKITTAKFFNNENINYEEFDSKQRSSNVIAIHANKKYYIKKFGGAVDITSRYQDKEEFFYYFLFQNLGVGPRTHFVHSKVKGSDRISQDDCLYIGTEGVDNIEFTSVITDSTDAARKDKVNAMNKFFEAVFNLYDIGHENTGLIKGEDQFVIIDFSVKTLQEFPGEQKRKKKMSSLTTKLSLPQLQHLRKYYLSIENRVPKAMDEAERTVENFAEQFPNAFLSPPVDLGHYKKIIKDLMNEFGNVVLSYIKQKEEESKGQTQQHQQERGRKTEPRVSPRGVSPDKNTNTSPSRGSSPKRSVSTTRGASPKRTTSNQSPEKKRDASPVRPRRGSSSKR
ncbi:hypothetical protein AKO1_006472 [Acrasis kona]|uniref:Uncharacterized protein n=1 Tax=Acrasis kona TaxID=1008807 RepID=A0AAW2YJZ9_9EUKA